MGSGAGAEQSEEGSNGRRNWVLWPKMKTFGRLVRKLAPENNVFLLK